MRTNALTPNVSRRGVARVSAVWMIFLIVLLLVVLGYAYIAQDEASSVARARAEAVAAQREAESQFEDLQAQIASRSASLGFTEDAATIPSNVEAAQAALEEIKQVFPDMEPVKTYQDLVPAAIQAYRARVEQISTLEGRIAELTSQVEAERSAKDDLEREKDARIAQLEQEKRDGEETSSSEISNLESTVSDLTSNLRTSNDRITELEESRRSTQRALDEEKLAAQSTKGQYTKRLNDIQRRAEKADGEISAVLPNLGVGFINISARDRLSEGTRFRIISGKPGADVNEPKAFAVVTDVGPRFSEVRIEDVKDRFQPVVAGDKIYNPLYERKGDRNAVLAGAIAGAYNKPELELLFKEIGINIQNEISNSTDFLITGGPLFNDPVTGEPLEDPLQVDQLPVYGEARDQGVTVIPIRDILQYFER
ncbi:MAG: hypothetical protein AAF726_23330 [Planctomycetota bacterium]